MESQSFYVGLTLLAAFLFIIWFVVGRKGGYGRPTALNLKKGEAAGPIVQVDTSHAPPSMRDVTPQASTLGTKPPTPPTEMPVATFVYNGHDWDAFEVLGVSPYSSFSEITKQYQTAIKKADGGKHEFLQAAYMAILKIK